MILKKFEISAGRPIPEDQRGYFGPSAELVRFKPAPVQAAEVVGRRIDEVCANLGTYGMGGPGMFGLRLDAQWLVFALWSAGAWMVADGRRVEDTYYLRHGAPPPWRSELGDELSGRVLGGTIAALEVRRRSMDLSLDDGFAIRIHEDPATRPVWEGNQKPRKFGWRDDLRRAVFLCPTDEIWT